MLTLSQRPEPGFSPLGAFPADHLSRTQEAAAALKGRRHPRYGFLDAGTDHEEIARIATMAKAIVADDLLVLGIGGSALGTVAFMHATNAKKRDRVHVLESPDPVHLSAVLARLDPAKTAVNIVSKSGTTLETLSQWSVIESWLHATKVFDKQRIVVTTDPKSGPLRAHATEKGYATLPVPEMIGGRYSVFTPVGLLPLAWAGVELEGLAAGVRQGSERFDLAAKLASTLVHSQLGEGRSMVVVWPYGERLQAIGRWFQQLWAESLGKATHLDGTRAHVGNTPVACVGPNDQHSLLQLFADGPKDKHYLFLAAKNAPATLRVERPIPGSEFLTGKSLQDILLAEARATFAALASQGHPCSFLMIDDMSATAVADLFVQLMSATVIGAALYAVDPFDQPAVELGKRIALGLLGHEKHRAEADAMARYLP